jgi:NhaA family Na+:H+ antiporter
LTCTARWTVRVPDARIALDAGLTLTRVFLLAAGLGSVILLAATLLSLVLANSSASAAWVGVWETHVGPAALGLHLSLREWVNEGLMAIFFFVVGVDIKKEFVYGSLASVRKAVLPCLGALGGMVLPMVCERAAAAPAL